MMIDPGSDGPITNCATCPAGRASGVGRGGRCPFVARLRPAGSYVYFQGEPADVVWFVKKGTVVLSRSPGDVAGEDSAHAVRRVGSFIGIEALVSPTYLDSARVTEDATLCGTSRENASLWLGPPETPARITLEQVLRASYAEAPRAAGADGSAVQRVARWVLEEARDGRAPSLPRHIVANLLGMVPETFSRALAQLSRRGAIDLTRKLIRVKDPDTLRDLARG